MSWIEHVKDYQKKNNVSYKEAMTKAKDTYKRKTPIKAVKKENITMIGDGKKADMTIDDKIHLFVARASYKPINKRKKELPNGYILDNDISNEKSVLYYNPDTKHAIVGFRGTNDLSDLIPDVSIALGTQKKNKDFVDSVKFYDNVKTKYDDYRITTTGHSKGASQSGNLSQERDIKATVFNLPTGLDALYNKPDPNVRHIRKKGDVLSTLTKLDKDDLEIEDTYLTYNPFTNHSTDDLITKEEFQDGLGKKKKNKKVKKQNKNIC